MTGYPELDRLIWSTEPMGFLDPLGFPVGRITAIDGTEIPEGWAERVGALVCPPDAHTIGRAVLLSRPPVAFVMGEPVGCDYEKLLGLLGQVGTALVILVPGEVQEKALKYHSYLRLRFADGEVTVIKNALAPTQGHRMKWPVP